MRGPVWPKEVGMGGTSNQCDLNGGYDDSENIIYGPKEKVILGKCLLSLLHFLPFSEIMILGAVTAILRA